MKGFFRKMLDARWEIAKILVIIACLIAIYEAFGQASGKKNKEPVQLSGDSKAVSEIQRVLQKFQDGYTKRDVKVLDEFMELFVESDALEVIGTNAAERASGEWCWGHKAVSELVKTDWKNWGDVSLDVKGARIHSMNNVAWLATLGTVTRTEDSETKYRKVLDQFEKVYEKDISKEEKILEILMEGTNALYETRNGETYVWPLRFTAVLVKREGRWKFHQMQFSFPKPTGRKPGVRL